VLPFSSATRRTALFRCTGAWTSSRWTKGVPWRRRPHTASYATPIRAATVCQQTGMDRRWRCVFLLCMQGLHLAASGAKGLEAVHESVRPRPLALTRFRAHAVLRTEPRQPCSAPPLSIAEPPPNSPSRASPPPPAAPTPSPGSPLHCPAAAGLPDQAVAGHRRTQRTSRVRHAASRRRRHPRSGRRPPTL
jgi:hypothetical protein